MVAALLISYLMCHALTVSETELAIELAFVSNGMVADVKIVKDGRVWDYFVKCKQFCNEWRFIGAAVGSVAQASSLTSWKSRWLYILVNDHLYRIKTSTARQLLFDKQKGGTSDIELGQKILKHLKQIF